MSGIYLFIFQDEAGSSPVSSATVVNRPIFRFRSDEILSNKPTAKIVSKTKKTNNNGSGEKSSTAGSLISSKNSDLETLSNERPPTSNGFPGSRIGEVGSICSSWDVQNSSIVDLDVFGHLLETIVCQLCGHDFSDKDSFHRHSNILHRATIQKTWQPCDTCLWFFPSKKALRSHSCDTKKQTAPLDLSVKSGEGSGKVRLQLVACGA